MLNGRVFPKDLSANRAGVRMICSYCRDLRLNGFAVYKAALPDFEVHQRP
jgi:hypothetical protein